jgi:hypothetical protein
VWAISRGEVPSPSTPSVSDSRLSCPLTPAGVPVMFRRSSGSSPNSKRSIEQLRCSERCTSRGEREFDPSHGGSQGFKSPHLHPLSQQVRASSVHHRRRSPRLHDRLGPHWATPGPPRQPDHGAVRGRPDGTVERVQVVAEGGVGLRVQVA